MLPYESLDQIALAVVENQEFLILMTAVDATAWLTVVIVIVMVMAALHDNFASNCGLLLLLKLLARRWVEVHKRMLLDYHPLRRLVVPRVST